jgi:tRNA(fMet)-specific endonuclease VapC
MNERFLLDTNALSEPLRPTPSAAFLARARQHEHEIATAAPAFHELLFGCLRLPPSRRRAQLERYIRDILVPSIPILPYDPAAAEWHAVERARLTSLGRTPPFVDGQIAAIAATRGLILVTANVADFQSFADLSIIDWGV